MDEQLWGFTEKSDFQGEVRGYFRSVWTWYTDFGHI